MITGKSTCPAKNDFILAHRVRQWPPRVEPPPQAKGHGRCRALFLPLQGPALDEETVLPLRGGTFHGNRPPQGWGSPLQPSIPNGHREKSSSTAGTSGRPPSGECAIAHPADWPLTRRPSLQAPLADVVREWGIVKPRGNWRAIWAWEESLPPGPPVATIA